MINITIRFKDNTFQDYESIIKVQYTIPMVGREIVEGENLFSYDYPIGTDLQLFSEKTAYKVSGKDIKEIKVEKVSD